MNDVILYLILFCCLLEIPLLGFLWKRRDRLTPLEKAMIKVSLETSEDVLMCQYKNYDPYLLALTLQNMDKIKEKL